LRKIGLAVLAKPESKLELIITPILEKFLRRAQNEFDAKVKKIRSDSGTEFKNTQAEDFLDEEGIKHEFLAPYTPQ
jgi:hypothetical protein